MKNLKFILIESLTGKVILFGQGNPYILAKPVAPLQVSNIFPYLKMQLRPISTQQGILFYIT